MKNKKFNKEIKHIRKNQTENMRLENTMTDPKTQQRVSTTNLVKQNIEWANSKMAFKTVQSEEEKKKF